MNLNIVNGDILDQEVDVIVNAWNRNFIPWWLLLPQGVSGAIKKKAGISPFKELGRKGILNLGEAVLTNAGKLKYKGIIHVAGINAFWTATIDSIKLSTMNAIKLAESNHIKTIAFPLIGAGTGRFKKEKVLEIMISEIEKSNTKINVIIVIKD